MSNIDPWDGLDVVVRYGMVKLGEDHVIAVELRTREGVMIRGWEKVSSIKHILLLEIGHLSLHETMSCDFCGREGA